MKTSQTFEQRHTKALEKAHAELRAQLRSLIAEDYTGLGQDEFINSAAAYAHVMGYTRIDSEPAVGIWLRAVDKAWCREVREKGDRMVLGDALDRAVRESTIAIGERWPEERRTAKRAA